MGVDDWEGKDRERPAGELAKGDMLHVPHSLTFLSQISSMIRAFSSSLSFSLSLFGTA